MVARGVKKGAVVIRFGMASFVPILMKEFSVCGKIVQKYEKITGKITKKLFFAIYDPFDSNNQIKIQDLYKQNFNQICNFFDVNFSQFVKNIFSL